MNPVHAFAFSFFKIRFNIILASSVGLLSILFPSVFPTKHCIYSLSLSACHMTSTSDYLAASHPSRCPVPAAVKKLDISECVMTAQCAMTAGWRASTSFCFRRSGHEPTDDVSFEGLLAWRTFRSFLQYSRKMPGVTLYRNSAVCRRWPTRAHTTYSSVGGGDWLGPTERLSVIGVRCQCVLNTADWPVVKI